jgi:pimeloyl-ACP methyl ester carboxylesterase
MPASVATWVAVAMGLAAPFAIVALMLAIEVGVTAIADPRVPPCSPWHLLRLWFDETLVSYRAFLWRQPFASRFMEPTVVADPRRPAVLLVHGFMCNRAVWQPLLDAGLLRGFNVATVDLLPVYGDIDRYAEVIDAALARLLGNAGVERAILVGHSMGGLAMRAYLRRYGDAKVARVITLGTPHAGTIFGHVGLGRNARQMATGSKFLADLAASEDAARRARFVCIATRDDNLIAPRSSPLLPGATHHLLDGVGHLALTVDPRAWKLVVDEIRAS